MIISLYLKPLAILLLTMLIHLPLLAPFLMGYQRYISAYDRHIGYPIEIPRSLKL
jgi:hypothetical protein